MKRSYVAPDSFEVTPERREWAIQTFKIKSEEVDRQTELWHEHEFKRPYHDWGRCWKRWFRTCEQYNLFKREIVRPNTVSTELTEAEREDERRKAEENIRRLTKMAEGVR